MRLRRPSDPYLIHQHATRFRRLCHLTQAHSGASSSTTGLPEQTQKQLLLSDEDVDVDVEERADEAEQSGVERDAVVESVRGAGCSLNRTLEFVVVPTSQVTLLQQFGIEPSAFERSAKTRSSALLLAFQVRISMTSPSMLCVILLMPTFYLNF